MRSLLRNKRVVYFCDPEETNVIVVDSNGNRTGERNTIYSDPVPLNINVSAARGESDVNLFGNADMYDKIMVTADVDCPITENSVLFVDKAPSFTEVRVLQKAQAGSVARVYLAPLYDYVVVRVAKSINGVSFAIKKVPVAGQPVPLSGGNP